MKGEIMIMFCLGITLGLISYFGFLTQNKKLSKGNFKKNTKKDIIAGETVFHR